MASARYFIIRALQSLGVIEASEVPTSNDLDLGFTTLNEWVTDLGTQRASIFALGRAVYPLTGGKASYTIGPGGDFDQPRPIWLERASVLQDLGASPEVELPLGPPLTDAQYQGITVKSTQGRYPTAVYYDHAFVGAGLGHIVVWPVPMADGPGLVLYTPTAMTAFTDLTTDYAFPQGYARVIRTNLALELAPAFHAVPSPALIEAARDSLSSIKRANHRSRDLRFDGALVGPYGRRYNVYTDQ